MNKTESPRKINKNIFYGKLHMQGLTLGAVGKKMIPPVSRFRVCQIINKCHPAYRLNQITEILGTNIQTLFPKK